MGTIEKQMKEKLVKALDPDELEIINESQKHVHHKGNPGGDETHFQIFIKCPAFKGLPHLERHKKIYDILKEEVPKIHALSLKLKT